jgi:NitT/TauT family transport system substrate-binding protein
MSNDRASRTLAMALAGVIALLFATACKKTEAPAQASTQTPAQSTSTPPAGHTAKFTAYCTHSVGLCNLPLFIADADRNTPDMQNLDINIELKSVPDWGKHALALQKKDVDFSITPFTTVMVAYAAGAPLRIIAGSGVNGLRLVAARGINNASQLRGKRIGTFRADTLEMMLFSYLARNNMSYRDVEIVYFDDSFGLLSAYKANKIDAITHVEPYATRAMKERESVLLASGEGPAVWNTSHPDCVLVTTSAVLQDPTKRETAKRLIKALLIAQKTIESDPAKAAQRTAQHYFRGKTEDIVAAGATQRPGVDILNGNEGFMQDRFNDLKKIGYIRSEAEFAPILDLSLLNEVLSERASKQ